MENEFTEYEFLTDKQLISEISKCEYCEEKPCKTACPVDCSAADFIMAFKMGNPSDIRRSAAHIMEQNPLGGVCGVVCPDWHCMDACVHKKLDGAVNIPTVQAAIIQKAKELDLMPTFAKIEKNGKKIGIIGAGPTGLAAAAYLARSGYSVDLYERGEKIGGTCNLIPDCRLPKEVLRTDIDFILSLGEINLFNRSTMNDPKLLFEEKKYDSVLVTPGLTEPIGLGIENEYLGVNGTDYLTDPTRYVFDGRVAIIGGGAVAVDCAITARRNGAELVEMFALEKLGEMPLSANERGELFEYGIEVSGRSKVMAIIEKNGKVSGLETMKVILPAGVPFNLRDIKESVGTQQTRNDIDHVIVAIGTRPGTRKIEEPGIFFAGDLENGPTTVVEAVAAGKNVASQIDAYLGQEVIEKFASNVKSTLQVPGYNNLPVPLETDFFGRRIRSPFLLSAAPPSDGYDQMKKAYDAGWAGGVMKTSFDNLDIHIPAGYMNRFDDGTYGNCDNVSGHQLDRIASEVERLVREYPDRLTLASTGGPVSGNDEEDKRIWQSNTRKLEAAGVMGIEYSLSCPQGGDGTEGDIVSQNAALSAKIIDWVLEKGDPEIPKLFKLTGAVTSIAAIVMAIRKTFDNYPHKKAGITLANTFPTFTFKQGDKQEWEEGVVVGMSGEGVLPISYLSLASVSHLGVAVSGNGGPMDYKAAADFLALGVNTVQFCTMVLKYGYNVYDELASGISHLMEERGIASMDELIGRALPNPICDFMELSPVKMISTSDRDLCLQCGNCTRCPYLAISLDEEGYPVTDPERCIGCSLCTLKCFSGALSMRDRTPEETSALKED